MAEHADAADLGETEAVVSTKYAGPMMASAELSEALDTLKYNHAQALGVSVTDMLAMSFILRSGMSTPKAIGSHLQMTTGAVTALLDRLELQGILARAANPEDRRSTLISLTPSGSESITGDWVDFERRIASVAEGRTAEELEIVTTFLLDLAAALRS